MDMFGKPQGERFHTRRIEMNAYEYDKRRFVLEGTLTDHRAKEYHLAIGEKRPAGVLHQMIIRLLVVKAGLVIEDLEVEMPVVPRDVCRENIDSLAEIKGLRIAGGFTSKIKEIAGGRRGCNHLVSLLTAMGPTAVLGYDAYYDQGRPGFLTDNYKALMNTCRSWREGGPLLDILKEKIRADQQL